MGVAALLVELWCRDRLAPRGLIAKTNTRKLAMDRTFLVDFNDDSMVASSNGTEAPPRTTELQYQ